MKRIQLIILLAITFCNCFAQNLHNITLSNTSVSVDGDRLVPVKGKNQVWEIDLRSDQEVFQLISKNKTKVVYKLSGNFVNVNPGGDMNIIPYVNNTTNFYKSAHLVLKKNSLPITISVNNAVIATFQLKKRIIYQGFTLPQNNIFHVGDTLNVTKENPQKTDVVISEISVKIKDGKRTIDLADSTITEELLGNKDSIDKCQIIYTIKYADGNVKKESSNNIKIKKISNGDKTIYFIGSIFGLIFLATLLFFFIWKRKHHNDEAENKLTNRIVSKILFWRKENRTDKKDKSEDREQTGNSTQTNPLEEFQGDHTSTPHDIGAEEVIKEYIRQINELKSRISKLEHAQDSVIMPNTSELRERIKELEESEKAKLDEIEELSSENSRITAENKALQDQLSATTLDNASKKNLRRKIDELNTEKNKVIRENQSKERELVDARKNLIALESKIKEKDNKISEINKQKDEAESKFRIEKNSTAVLQNKINSFSKQTHYLFAIDDAMQAVDNSLKHLFTDVRDENLMKRLAQPVLSGTAGLDAGLESYLNEWKNSVYGNQKLFFGDDVLNLSDDTVKEKLAEFLEQLALRDSFGKLVRLYLMTNVGWINEKMVAAGFNVDAIQTLFARFINLFTLFNIEISYPRLFVDKFDSNRHKDNMRCEIFNYFEPSEELLAQLKMRENENLIVDVTRIGIPNSKTPARRNAMVSLPNF